MNPINITIYKIFNSMYPFPVMLVILYFSQGPIGIPGAPGFPGSPGMKVPVLFVILYYWLLE